MHVCGILTTVKKFCLLEHGCSIIFVVIMSTTEATVISPEVSPAEVCESWKEREQNNVVILSSEKTCLLLKIPSVIAMRK